MFSETMIAAVLTKYQDVTTFHKTISTEECTLAQKYIFKLIKPGYMFQLYSHHQAYLQSLVELYMLNAYAMLGSQ
jgi:hypothetical protein